MAGKKTTAKAEEIKTVPAPQAAVKAEPAKAEPAKTEIAKEETAAPAAKKTQAKKPAAKKTSTAAKKTPAKKAQTDVEVFVEFNGVQVSLNEVIENVKTNNVKDAKELKIYLKPEDNTAYYVADGKESQIKVYFC